MPRHRAWIIFAILVAVTARGYWHWVNRSHRLSFVPAIMGVDTILYAKEEAWGFGPGGNETGLISYAMPEAVARSLNEGGLTWLQSLQTSGGRDWHGVYEKWMSTPVDLDDVGKGRQWKPASCECLQQWSHPDIRDYLSAYGFGTPLDLRVVEQVNNSIFNDGSFYAYGRVGMIVLDPKARRIFYGYNG
jgi:hypothetical protein